MLAKRDSENYLTFSLLEARPDAGGDHRRCLDAWDRLSAEQKDFLDMKNGLENPPSSHEVEQLFQRLQESDRQALEQGFGPNIGKCWDAREHNVRVNAELRERGGGDLERGIQIIMAEV